MKSVCYFSCLLAFLCVLSFGCSPAEEKGKESGKDKGNGEAKGEALDIVDTAVAAGDFTTLATALTTAGLVETLKGEGPFTVFAPTDEAFGKLPEGTLDELLKPESKEKLTGILTYHVVSGKVTAAEVVKLTEADTVQGSKVPILVEGETVKVGGATVTKTDIECKNGVIHVIDTVLIPE